MKTIVFATNNSHKLKEVSEILDQKIRIVSLNEISCTDDIPETAETLEGNALLKAQYVYKKYGLDCFADDTGLEVEVLNNMPGVHTARYAGEDCNTEANMAKLLQALDGETNRKARFRTSISLIIEGTVYYFEGVVNGSIAREKQGSEGFGYDPIFIPEGYNQSFAELGEEIKNKISHRALAVERLLSFLRTLKA